MFCRHLAAEGRIARDPTALLAAPVLRRSLPRTLAVDEVERLLETPPRPSRAGRWRAERDRALLEVLYACGARVSEAVSLRTSEIEPSLRVLRLLGKGSKTRSCPGQRAGGGARGVMSGGRRSSRTRRAPSASS
jgi:integrase/recombinase XerD